MADQKYCSAELAQEGEGYCRLRRHMARIQELTQPSWGQERTPAQAHCRRAMSCDPRCARLASRCTPDDPHEAGTTPCWVRLCRQSYHRSSRSGAFSISRSYVCRPTTTRCAACAWLARCLLLRDQDVAGPCIEQCAKLKVRRSCKIGMTCITVVLPTLAILLRALYEDQCCTMTQEDLDFRRRCLGAASVHHLCKSLIMVNTRVPEGQPRLFRYVAVVVQVCCWLVVTFYGRYFIWHVTQINAQDQGGSATESSELALPQSPALISQLALQYTAALNGDKLNRAVRAMASSLVPDGAPPVSAKMVNMRLCPADVSQELTGFEHNAVSPVGCRTQLPMIMSDRILKLHPDWFWLGAAQTDLKLGLSAASFVRAYQPTIADIC